MGLRTLLTIDKSIMAVSLSTFAAAANEINQATMVLLTWASRVMAIIILEGRNYLSLAESYSPLLAAAGLSGFERAATLLALVPLVFEGGWKI